MSVSLESNIERVLKSYAEAKNHHDVPAVVKFCHPEGSYESIGLSDRVQGRDALTAFYTQLFELLPDYCGEFDGQAINGDTAVVWGHFSGTISSAALGKEAVGRRIDVPVTFVCTFREGLVYSDTGYFDAATVYRQAGLPVPPLGIYPRAASFVDRLAAHWADPKPEDFRDVLHPDTINFYPGMAEPQGTEGTIAWLRCGVPVDEELARHLHLGVPAEVGESLLQRLGFVETLDDAVLAAVGEPAEHRFVIPIGELVIDS